MTYTKWIESAKIDYISPFLKLWIWFNSRYEDNFIRKQILTERLPEIELDSISMINIKIYDILLTKWIIEKSTENINWENKEIIKVNSDYIIKKNFLKIFEDIFLEEILKIRNLLKKDKYWDISYIKKIYDDSSFWDIIDELMLIKDFKDNIILLSNYVNLFEKINMDSNQEVDFYRFFYSFLSDNTKDDKRSIYKLLRDITEAHYDKEWKYIEELDYNDMKNQFLTWSFIDKNTNKDLYYRYKYWKYLIVSIFEYIDRLVFWTLDDIEKKQEYMNFFASKNYIKDKLVKEEFINNFLEDDEKLIYYNSENLKKSILLIIYLVRNKLVHWEFMPEDENVLKIIKIIYDLLNKIFYKLENNYENT